MAKDNNLWNWSDSELEAQIESIAKETGGQWTFTEEYDRKRVIEYIKKFHVWAAENVEETKSYIDKIKAEQPKLETRKVVFHSIGEFDIPYVFVGHNGLAFYIPKEVEVDVPLYILQSCIKDAVEDRMFPYTTHTGEILWKIRKVQRYPYSFVG